MAPWHEFGYYPPSRPPRGQGWHQGAEQAGRLRLELVGPALDRHAGVLSHRRAAWAAGVPLFPTNQRDLATSCSCPDWSNPCKHVAAVYYLLAEAFDRDPFLLFRLRGMERDGFVALLGLGGATGGEETPVAEAQAAPAEPLTTDLEAVWSAPKGYDGLLKTDLSLREITTGNSSAPCDRDATMGVSRTRTVCR